MCGMTRMIAASESALLPLFLHRRGIACIAHRHGSLVDETRKLVGVTHGELDALRGSPIDPAPRLLLDLPLRVLLPSCTSFLAPRYSLRSLHSFVFSVRTDHEGVPLPPSSRCQTVV